MFAYGDHGGAPTIRIPVVAFATCWQTLFTGSRGGSGD